MFKKLIKDIQKVTNTYKEEIAKVDEETLYRKAYAFYDKNRVLYHEISQQIELVQKHLEKADPNLLKAYQMMNSTYQKAQEILQDLEAKLNAKRAKKKEQYVDPTFINELRESVGKIGNYYLDDQQLACIAKEEKNHLVLAGAGTGKSTTIIGYVKYLLKHKKVNPLNILVLSFTKAAAKEMEERIKEETHQPIRVRTFHAIGNHILSSAYHQKDIKESPDALIREAFFRKYHDNSLKSLVHSYFYEKRQIDVLAPYEDLPLAKALQKPKDSPINDSANASTYSSNGEALIANYLHYYNIPFEYTYNAYLIGTYPFYLPTLDKYIDYLHMPKEELPVKDTCFLPIPGTYGDYKNTCKEYHRNKKGKLLERTTINDSTKEPLVLSVSDLHNYTFFYKLEKTFGHDDLPSTPTAIDFKASLRILGSDYLYKNYILALKAISYYNKITYSLRVIVDYFQRFISILKMRNLTAERAYELFKIDVGDDTYITNDAFAMVDIIYKAYEKILEEQKAIDFNDMINLSIEALEQGLYKHHYDYIIIDEYQDMAPNSYRLMQALRDVHDYTLFCVGDDWQCIYGFTGSNIKLTTSFANYWGKTEESRIETTYRFNKHLIDVSSHFILENEKQKKKSLRSPRKDTSRAVTCMTYKNYNDCHKNILDILVTLPENSSVLFLGRYNCCINQLFYERDDDRGTLHKISEKEGAHHLIYSLRKDLQINFMTMHGSKGLEADYVFLLDLKKDEHKGVPCLIETEPEISFLLDHEESYSLDDERRLFYVALTRAKKHVYLLAPEEQPSVYFLDIKEALEK